MDWDILWQYREALWQGLVLTVHLWGISLVGSIFLGATVGCLGALPGFFLQRIAATYVELLRNVPVLVKVVFLYYAVGLDAFLSAALGLIIHQSAYIADMISAGFRAIPHEQTEGARATGLNQFHIFTYVLLPQAVAYIVPLLTTQFIELIKNTAIAMLIGIEELTFQTQKIETETFRGFEAATAATIMYLLLAVMVAVAMALLQRRLRVR